MLFYDLDKETLEKIIPEIEQLPEIYRQAVYLAEVEQFSYPAISERLKISVFATKSRVQRGRQKLKTLLQSKGIYPTCFSFKL